MAVKGGGGSSAERLTTIFTTAFPMLLDWLAEENSLNMLKMS